ncbi:hypothetical protein ACWGR2_15695, partial [Streptomyces decoyicus]
MLTPSPPPSPSRVSLLLGKGPLWAAAAGIALGGERLGVLGLASSALVTAGTAWGRRAEGQADERRMANGEHGKRRPPPGVLPG